MLQTYGGDMRQLRSVNMATLHDRTYTRSGVLSCWDYTHVRCVWEVFDIVMKREGMWSTRRHLSEDSSDNLTDVNEQQSVMNNSYKRYEEDMRTRLGEQIAENSSQETFIYDVMREVGGYREHHDETVIGVLRG
ncbi:hypothetical protein Tco_1301506 [Tanacetum coccineum]